MKAKRARLPTGYKKLISTLLQSPIQAARTLTYLHRLPIAHPRERMCVVDIFVLALWSRLVGNFQASQCSPESGLRIEVPQELRCIVFQIPTITSEFADIREATCQPIACLQYVVGHERSYNVGIGSLQVLCDCISLVHVSLVVDGRFLAADVRMVTLAAFRS